MIITPFIVNNIYKIASLFVVEFYESDKITPIKNKDHTIICGYSILGRKVALQLKDKNKPFKIEYILLSPVETVSFNPSIIISLTTELRKTFSFCIFWKSIFNPA